MRLVQVAKALGMTGQQLRKELEQVDFGVKPTDREIPDNLAQGVIRFVARQKGIEVDMEALGFIDEEAPDEGEQAEMEEVESEEVVTEPVKPKASPKAKAVKVPKKKESSKESLNVLRKLTLDDVSEEAIKQEKAKLKSASPTKKAAVKTKPSVPKTKATSGVQQQIKKKEGVVMIGDQVTVKEYAEKIGVQVPQIVSALMKNGIMATITQSIDFDTAAIVAAELGIEVQKEQSAADVEHLFSRNLEEMLKDEPENLSERPPIVVVMGHVDHGKTAILDAIRETDVVAGEAGGITQHIGAYQVKFTPKGEKELKSITFLDTPGHEAFTAMRARGAQITDIAIIVVSAEEGVKPTTIEAINHAQDAGVPILVAINKMDKENADPDKVLGELAGHGLQGEDWGGQTPVVKCSAKSKLGIDELLEHLLLMAEIAELKGNPNRGAIATVVESHLDTSLGPLATVVVNTGTLKAGEVFLCGKTNGRVRAMMDAHGKKVDSVGPAGAVRVTGFQEVSEVGDILQVVSSEKEARELSEQLKGIQEQKRKRSFADLVSRLSEGKLRQLKIVLKADTQGSLEAIQESLAKLTGEGVAAKVIHAGIGSVTETDVMMAAASDGLVVAFHATVPAEVGRTAEREGVEVRQYDVIYALLEDVEGLVKGLVEPVEEEQILGHLEVKEVFLTKKKEQIVGGRVTDGVVKKLTFRLTRGEEEVGEGRITSLRKVDKDMKEVKEGTDCGMRVETSVTIEPGDIMEVYLKELKKKK